MNMPEDFALRGSPAQIKWATTIRKNSQESLPSNLLDQIKTVTDSTWWIANRDPENGSHLRTDFKAPEPHQLHGGPPAPPKTLIGGKGFSSGTVSDVPQSDGMPDLSRIPKPTRPTPRATEPTLNLDPTDTDKHDAERFAESVSHTPALAELAVLACLSRLYKGELRERFVSKIEARLDSVRQSAIDSIDKDVDGIRRIIRSK